MNDNPENKNLTQEDEKLFDAAFVERISRLKLAITKKSSLGYQGRRRSTLKGSSAEFSDYREYVPGDDIRRIDWNVYARLDKPYVRQYMEERESAVNIFLDMSASMAFGKKDIYAKKLAGAMALMALSNLDRTGLYIIYGDKVDNIRLAGGKNNIQRAFDTIEKAKCSQAGDIVSAVRSVPYIPSGLSILISDFCQESFLSGGRELCRYLSYRGQKSILLQVLSEEELRPGITGAHLLVDSEKVYDPVRISIEDKVLKTYDRELDSFLYEIKKIAKDTGIRYYLCDTGISFDRLIFDKLRDIYDV